MSEEKVVETKSLKEGRGLGAIGQRGELTGERPTERKLREDSGKGP